ncbi:MAG TPA: PTS sugar transporter subunit IIA [Polyangiaceae bacterium]|nr:PTS sugar transporter subunit IIA [Polyangiaceae bacterium]
MNLQASATPSPIAMRLSDIITSDRILVDREGAVKNKAEALRSLSRLLGSAVAASEEEVLTLLLEREQLQSTGIGDGVAIPHSALENAEAQAAALLLFPKGIDFESIDGKPVHIVFGVVGPKRATGEHLRTLARISRLLRDEATRKQLANVSSANSAYELIESHDAVSK